MFLPFFSCPFNIFVMHGNISKLHVLGTNVNHSLRVSCVHTISLFAQGQGHIFVEYIRQWVKPES